MSNNLFFGCMVGSKFNFIVSAAIFASTIYFLWIKIKRNTNFFNRDDSDDKCLENKSNDVNIESENEINSDKSKSILEQVELDENVIHYSTDIEFTNDISEISQQIDFENTIQIDLDSVDDFSDVDKSVCNNLSYSFIATTCLDKEVEDMLCNNLQNIDINSSTISDKSENCVHIDTLEFGKTSAENANFAGVVELRNIDLHADKIEELKLVTYGNESDSGIIEVEYTNSVSINGVESDDKTDKIGEDIIDTTHDIDNVEECGSIDNTGICRCDENAKFLEDVFEKVSDNVESEIVEDKNNYMDMNENTNVELFLEREGHGITCGVTDGLEEGEIIDESFIEKKDVIIDNDTPKDEDIVDMNENMDDEISKDMRKEINNESFEKQVSIKEDGEEYSIDETRLNKYTREINTKQLEEGEIIDESFFEKQDVSVDEDKAEVQLSIVDMNENMAYGISDIREEQINESLFEKQDSKEDEERHNIDETPLSEINTEELEEGEIFDESIIENQDVNGYEKDILEEQINGESLLENQAVSITEDGEEHSINEISNVERFAEGLKEDVFAESFIVEQDVNINEGSGEDGGKIMNPMQHNVEISENDKELKIIEESLINKQYVNVEESESGLEILLVDTYKDDVVEDNAGNECLNGTVEVNTIEEPIQDSSHVENEEFNDSESNIVRGKIHCYDEELNNNTNIDEEMIDNKTQDTVTNATLLTSALDSSNNSSDQLDETETNGSNSTAIKKQNHITVKESDDVDGTSDISQTSDYRNDSSLDSLLGGGSLMEYIEDCLSSKKSDGSVDNDRTNKLENWPNDDDCLNNIKRDFYDVSNNICSPHPSSESDHAHCVNNLTERVAILSAESILDSHGQINSSDSERTPTLSSPSFDECNPELYVEKITYGDKELDVVYFEESVLEEGGVQTDVKIVRTIPVGLGGRIIGKKGKTKNELMKKFGAQLLIYNHPDEIGKQVLQITCNPSVSDQLERWVNKTLEQITKNTIQTTVSHPEWLKPMIPLGRLVAAHVVDMSTIQHVKLRIYDAEIIKAYSKMQLEMNADYGSGDSTSLLPRPVAIGCVCVAMIRPDYFLRAQIIEIYEDIARVYLFDIGKVCQTYLFYLFKIREKYMRVPFQVIPARLPHALMKNQNISPAVIHKRFLCDQKTMKPKMVRVFFPRMNTCCEPCANIYIPMSTVSDGSGSDDSEEFVDLLELLVSMDVCSMVRETINSDIQVKINSNHFKAFLNDKQRKQIANVTVPMYFQPCNNKFYEDYVEFKLLESSSGETA